MISTYLLAKYPRLSEGISIAFGKEAVAIYNLPQKIVSRVTLLGGKLLKSSNGLKTIDTIIHTLYEQEMLDVDFNIFLQDTVEFFLKAINEKVIFIEDQPIKQIDDREPEWLEQDETCIKIRNTSLECTTWCNFNCNFCYMNGGSHGKSFLDHTQIIYILKKLSEGGVKTICLTGGEPLSLPFFIDLLKFASDTFESVQIITNGSLITKKHAKMFACLPNLELRLSIYGYNESIYREVTGSLDSYSQVQRGIQYLIEADVITTFQYIANRINLDEFFSMIAQYTHNKNINVVMGVIYPIGRAKEHWEQLKYSLTQDAKIRTFLASGVIEDIDRIVSGRGSRLKNSFPSLLPCARDSIAVLANGDVTPCPILRVSQFKLGNLLDETFNSVETSEQRRNFIKKSSIKNIFECKSCEMRYHCRGGCPASKFYYKGEIEIQSPFCGLYNTKTQLTLSDNPLF